MENSSNLQLFATKMMHKYAQTGAGVRVRFTTPQYFAKFAKSLFDTNNTISAEVYHDRVSFFDDSGTLGTSELRQHIAKICEKIEDHLGLDRGKLFNYNFESV